MAIVRKYKTPDYIFNHSTSELTTLNNINNNKKKKKKNRLLDIVSMTKRDRINDSYVKLHNCLILYANCELRRIKH